MRIWAAVILCACGSLWGSIGGPLLYQSATYVPSGNSGLVVYNDQLDGVRFSVSSPTTITAIGGHLYSIFTAPGPIWGAVVHLSSMSDYPDSTSMTTSDVLATALFTPPASAGDVIVPIAPLAVSPGTYALVFGGADENGNNGALGATGMAAMPNTGATVGSPSPFSWNSQNGWADNAVSPTHAERFTVYQVPEPASATIIMLVGLLLRRRPSAR
jgi:hypothetical protein